MSSDKRAELRRAARAKPKPETKAKKHRHEPAEPKRGQLRARWCENHGLVHEYRLVGNTRRPVRDRPLRKGELLEGMNPTQMGPILAAELARLNGAEQG